MSSVAVQSFAFDTGFDPGHSNASASKVMEQTKTALFPFLLLSRELRDNIYDHLLTSSRNLPSWPEDVIHRKPPSGDEVDSWEHPNHYAVEDLKNDSTALQLTCHQIYRETQAAIARLNRRGQLPFRLDLMMVDETMLYPTWLSYPATLNKVPKLDVDVRLFGDVGGKRSMWTPGCGGPPIMVWSLFFLLKRFLFRGPDFMSPVKSIKKPYVRELSINIVTPSPVPPEGFIIEDNRFCRSFRFGKRKGLINPETVLDLMTNHMRYLLSRTYYTRKYAKILFERIERITFSLDGHPKQSWDLFKLQLNRLPQDIRRDILLLTEV